MSAGGRMRSSRVRSSRASLARPPPFPTLRTPATQAFSTLTLMTTHGAPLALFALDQRFHSCSLERVKTTLNQDGGRNVVNVQNLCADLSHRSRPQDVPFLDLKIVHISSTESYFLWISKNYFHQQVGSKILFHLSFSLHRRFSRSIICGVCGHSSLFGITFFFSLAPSNGYI